MIRNRYRWPALLTVAYACFLFSMAGCGYTTRSNIAEKYRTIYVAQFANKIDITKEGDASGKYKLYKPLLETDITKSLINRLVLDGNVRIASSEAADLSLNGELLEFRRDAVRYTNTDDVEEYRISIIVHLRLWDNVANKLVWEEQNFTGDTTYFTQGSNAKAEPTAINDAITDLSRRIVERIVDEW